jgi:hypothetical protein
MIIVQAPLFLPFSLKLDQPAGQVDGHRTLRAVNKLCR